MRLWFWRAPPVDEDAADALRRAKEAKRSAEQALKDVGSTWDEVRRVRHKAADSTRRKEKVIRENHLSEAIIKALGGLG